MEGCCDAAGVIGMGRGANGLTGAAEIEAEAAGAAFNQGSVLGAP
jgi:hypothetical protein